MTDDIEIKTTAIINMETVYSVPENVLAEFEEECSSVPDCTVKENYEIVKKRIRRAVSMRNQIDTERKAIKREMTDRIDSLGNRIINRLRAVEGPHKDARDVIDKAEKERKELKAKEEQERVQKIQDAVGVIRTLGQVSFLDTVEDIQVRLLSLKAIVFDAFAEFTDMAMGAHKIAVGNLEDALVEAERLKLEKAAADARELELEKEAEALRKQNEKLEAEKAEAQAPPQVEFNDPPYKVEPEPEIPDENEPEQNLRGDAIAALNASLVDAAADGGWDVSANDLFEIAAAIVDNKIPGVTFTGLEE